MKNVFFIFLHLSFFSANSQNLKDAIQQIITIEQAEKFVYDNPDLEPEIFNLTPEIDNSFPTYFKTLKTGDLITEDGNIYKVISINKGKAYRVSYIYLNGSKLTMVEVNKLRSKIISDYKRGVPFTELAKKHTMDNNLTGDLNWFTKGMMVPEFENEIIKHKKGDIFTVDVPSNKWYYVTLKNYDDKIVTEITILKVKTN